jgi:hypothetical protein
MMPKITVVATAIKTVTPKTRALGVTESEASEASGPDERAAITSAMASPPNQAMHTPTAVPAAASSALSTSS